MTAKKEDRKIMEGIREFIKGCPCIQTYLDALKSDVNVEYLKDDEKNYSIESEPIDPIIRKYMDGSAIKQFAFIFSSRESYGREVIENLDFTKNSLNGLKNVTRDDPIRILEKSGK